MAINPIPIDNSKNTTDPKREIIFGLSEPKYTFKDVILSDEAQNDINEVIALRRFRNLIFETWGLQKVIKGQKNISVNLYGKSGTGKTMTAHAIADKLGKKLLIVNYSEIESKYVGETSKNLVSLFSFATNKDVVILFDEADALLSKRVTSMNSATDVSVNQTRNVLLKLLEEYEGVVLFTTNFIQNYDSAFFRRITNHIKFDMPNEEMREKLWEHYLVPQLPLEENRNLVISQLSKVDGVSGSDISNALLKAAVHTALKEDKAVKIDDLKNELSKIVEARNAMESDGFVVETKKVSEEYVKDKLGKAVVKNGMVENCV